MNKLLIPILILTNNCYSNTNDDYQDLSFLEETLTKTNKNKKYNQPVIIDLPNKLNSYRNSKNSNNRVKLERINNKLNLLIKSDDKKEIKYIIENEKIAALNYINLGVAFNSKLYKNLDFKTRLGIKLNNKINPFIKLTTKKTWKNIYGVDYTFGHIVKNSVINKLEHKSYLKLDKKLSDNYSIHNYYESYWGNELNKNTNVNSSIYLNQKLSNKSSLIYQIGLNSNNEDGTQEIKEYAIDIKYKIAIL
jgi:hypothetical protein